MIRTVLSNAQCERIAPKLPGKIGDPGRSGDDNRLFVEGVFWVARTGAPWRDLPDEFGKWYTVYTRFWRWAQKDVWADFQAPVRGFGFRIRPHRCDVGPGPPAWDRCKRGVAQYRANQG